MDAEGAVDYEMYNEGRGEGVIIGLKDQHYWRIKSFKKESGGKKDYEKPTIVMHYINERVNKEIKDEFRKRGLDCNISFKASRIYDMCETQSKRVVEKEEMKKGGVIYKMECVKCEEKGVKKEYIGETGRKLEIRMKEHCYKNKDEVKRTETFRHSEKEHQNMDIKNWRISVVRREEKEFDRKIKEAVEISRSESKINNSEGMVVIGLEWWRKRKKGDGEQKGGR
jgi:hypothetical protein